MHSTPKIPVEGWMRRLLLLTLLPILGLAPIHESYAKTSKDKYSKLFRDKKVDTVKGGLVTLHKVEEKLYMELPISEIGRDMLLGATLSSVSDGSILTIGDRSEEPLLMRFELQDSTVVVKKNNTIVYSKEADEPMKQALALSYRDPSVAAYSVLAFTPDSSAVVFDATSLMARESTLVRVIPKQSGDLKLSASPVSSLSFIKGMKSYEDNAQVRVELNYKLSATFLGMVSVASDVPTTVEATFTLLRLPEKTMPIRIADTRVGTFTTGRLNFSPLKDKTDNIYIAHRRRLEPADSAAYATGGLSKPKEPIVLYLDPAFPEEWKQPIRDGILAWNKPFEKIGFKDAIEVRDFPDPSTGFDPDNLKYSCIRYIPNQGENAYAPSWVDPRTGEIISSTLFIFNNIEQLFYKWYFTQSALVDPSIRNFPLPKEKRDAMLTFSVKHEMGHILGLSHNMIATAAVPTDSLRSASYVRAHGVTPSIMDYVRLNYVAQPGDNVPMALPEIGPYDDYVVEWLYRYFPLFSQDIYAQAEVLEKFVTSKSGDPRYRYLPEQTNVFDPRVISGDLGDDPIKSSDYGIKNLARISQEFPGWITDDEDTRKKDKLDLAISQTFHSLVKNVMHQIGGIYVNPSIPDAEHPIYTVLPRETQRASLKWVVDQIKDFDKYANRELECRSHIRISYYDQLYEFLINDLYNTRMRVLTAEHLVPGSYSQQEYFEDLRREVFASLTEHRDPTRAEILLQRGFINLGRAVVTDTKVPTVMVPTALKGYRSEVSFGDPTRSPYPQIRLEDIDRSSIYFFAALEKLRPELERAAKWAKSPEAKAHYSVLLFKTNKALKGE